MRRIATEHTLGKSTGGGVTERQRKFQRWLGCPEARRTGWFRVLCHPLKWVSLAESWWSGLVTEVFEALTPCRARKPALCGTARRCPMKGLQIRVWSWSWSSKPKYCAAVAVCVQIPQLIERSAFVRSRRYSSSSLEHDSPADSKIVAGAAILVENGPRATGSIARAIY